MTATTALWNAVRSRGQVHGEPGCQLDRPAPPDVPYAHAASSAGVEIAGAFGLDILRVGQMGEQCRSHNLFHTLYALGESTRLEGFPCDVSAGMATLERTLVAHSERPASDNGDGRAAPRP